MDADGMSFGDFGGGGGGAAGGKSTAQAKQDLMDTWFPDCRECACCKVCLVLQPARFAASCSSKAHYYTWQ